MSTHTTPGQHIKNPVVISVGGSLMVPAGGIDTVFLSQLNTFIRHYISQGRTFFLVAGGGRTARTYRDAGRAVIQSMTDEDLDWIGIHATRLNGHLLRTIFVDIAHPRVVETYTHKLQNWTEPLVIGAGWKPGHSTDHCAVYLAHEYGADTVINLSDIDHVYDSDPRTNPDAKPLLTTTWDKMTGLVGTKWTPSMNAPFDPIASQYAAHHDLKVIVCNGHDLTNVGHILDGRPFTGTLISNP